MSGFDINQLSITGNLTADPDLRSLQSGTSVCKIRIAHNKRVKDRDSGEWKDVPGFYDVIIWGGLGESIAKQVTKGDKVAVAGRLDWREYEKDGGKRQVIEIIADAVLPITAKNGAAAPAGTDTTADEDIPF